MLKSLISRRLISSTARSRTFTMATNPIRSPPAKRLKQELPADFTHITEAPVNAFFTEPSKSQQQPKKQTKRDRRKGRKPLPEPFSPADVMWHDVRDFLGRDYVDEVLGKKDGSEWEAPNELGSFAVVELTAGAFTVSGGVISLSPYIKSTPLTFYHRRVSVVIPIRRQEMGYHHPLCPPWRPYPCQNLQT